MKPESETKTAAAPQGVPHRSLFHVTASGLASAAGVIFCASTVAGFLGRWSWAFDLFDHFRMQYFLGLLSVALFLACLCRFRTAAAFGAFALVNATILAPLYVGGGSPGGGSGPVYRAMLMNVHTMNTRYDLALRAVEEADPHVLVVLETDARWIEALAPLRARFPHVVTCPSADNFGLALFSQFPLVDPGIVTLSPSGVPSVLAKVQTPEGSFTVLGLHPVPPIRAAGTQDRDAELRAVSRVRREAAGPALVLGDLNATPWSRPVRRLLREANLRNSGRGFGYQPTWPSFNPLFRIPIDHALHTPDIAIVSRRIGPFTGSDHYPLIVDFHLPARSE